MPPSSAQQEAVKFAVRLAAGEEDCKRVYRFRYRTLIDDIKGDSIHADHDAKILKDELDDGALELYMIEGSNVIAAVRDNLGAATIPPRITANFKLDQFGEYPPEALSLTSRTMVLD